MRLPNWLNERLPISKAAAQQQVNAAREDMRGPDVPKGEQQVTIYSADYRPGGFDFPVLRALSKQCEPVRLCLNTVKRLIYRLDWNIESANEDAPNEKEVTAGEEWFSTQGGIGSPGVRLREFVDQVVEDVLVVGAVALYKRPTQGRAVGLGGPLASVEVLDAAKIIPLRDKNGWIPQPPEAAYKQKLNDGRETPFTTDELRYAIWQARTYTSYGQSAVEDCMMAISQTMAADLYNLAWFTEGDTFKGAWYYTSTPGEAPSPQETAAFKQWFEQQKKKGKGKINPLLVTPPPGWKYDAFRNRTEADYIATQRFLLQRIAPFFGLTPSALGMESDTYKASQEAQTELSIRGAQEPLVMFLNELFTDILQTDLGLTSVKFEYALDITDQERQSRVARALGTQFATANDVQDMLGLPKFKGGYADDLFTVTAGGEVIVLASRDAARAELIGHIDTPEEKAAKEQAAAEAKQKQLEALQAGQAGQQAGSPPAAPGSPQTGGGAQKPATPLPQDNAAQKADLRRWRDKATKALKAGKSATVPFLSDVIPGDLQAVIAKQLEDGAAPTEVFAPYLQRPADTGAEWAEYLGRGLDGLIGTLEAEGHAVQQA